MATPWKSRTLLFLAGTTAYWTVIFVGTHAPGSLIHGEGHRDKFFHCTAFAGLAILLCGCASCFRRLGPFSFAAIIGLAAGYGILDELTQTLVVNRTADPLDWVADVCGAVLGTLIFALGAKLFCTRQGTHGETR